MGSLAVLGMAENAAPTDAPPRRPLHPFFAQNRPVMPTVVKPAVNGTSVTEDDPDLRHNTTVGDKSKGDAVCDSPTRPLKRHKADKKLNGDEEQRKARPRKRTRQSVGGGIAGHFVKLKGGSENTAQISVPDTSVVAGGITPDSSNQAAPGADIPHAQRLGNEQPTSNPPESNDHVTERAAVLPATAASSPAKPKKLLQFNPKTGTIGSPPKPKERKSLGTEPAGDGERKRRGRKPLSKIVRIAYGTDSESRTRIAERINGILHNQHPGAPASSKQAAASPVPAKPEPVSKPSKATHPFFLGPAKKTDSTPHDDKMNKPTSSPTRLGTKRYSSTPCSPRKSRTSLTSRSLLPQFGIKNVGLKFPGARLPAWPWQDMVHVRGEQPSAEGIIDQSISLPSRKSKGHAVEVPQTESVLNLITQSMEIPAIAESVRNIYTDHIIPPPPELRLPQKHFESGSKLQIRVLPELRTLQPHLFKKKPTQGQRPVEGSENKAQAPRQLARLFDSIATSLSAFDRSQCETANWAHKYAPISAAEVLQSGPEAFLLKDWLQALTVQSVDTGPAETESSKTGSKAKGAGAGKKKRRKKLDGFIVSSEDEDYELNELSDEDDSWAPSGSRGILRKTVVRSVNAKGKDGDRTANTLVISGPHGCGKTAAVYAVAKELDFEVFEINSSSRRSGKDVLEKIGDMTRNHHVQQHQQASAEDDQHRIAEDEVANDIKSGKQSTMNAFFKPKPGGTKPSVVRPKQSTKASAHRPQNETKKEPAKAQRQSLILLEEVDILYEEDKQFWTTIVSLIAQAKRPFIMTCNDETLVPLHTLRLHGIFRFSTPPRDLAIDRLILIAANEGHAITRHAAEHLYVSRNCDLRAATMDLQYWCQMGVGDRRGGFDWFYPRWPKGVDLDESGRVVRVVSQGTYLPGMNFLGRDSIVDPKTTPGLVEEEIMSQAWESWGLDVGHWQDSIGMEPWAEGLQQAVATPGGRLRTLVIYDDLVEAMSAADIFSCHSFAEFKRAGIDPTYPEQPIKTQEDYVLGFTHLDTPSVTHYDSLATSIALTTKSLARCCLQDSTEKLQGHPEPALQPLDEDRIIDYMQTSFSFTPPGAPAIDRMDFSFAFDPIAAADGGPLQSGPYLEPSVFDRTLTLIALDVAPYVRGIVAYDSQLQKQRLRLSNLVSEGGGSKRMRTTRAALSALEGGSRSTTRGEKWFKADLNPYLVAKTAGVGWDKSGEDGARLETEEESLQSSPKTMSDSSPRRTPKRVARKSRKRKMVVREDDSADELS